MRIFRALLLFVALACSLVAGCDSMGCTATQSCPAMNTKTVQTTPNETVVHDAIVDSLKQAGFHFTTDPHTAQGLWVRGGDQVIFSASDLLDGSIVITFPEGKLVCNTIGADASGYNPLDFIDKAKANGYAKMRANQSICDPISS